MLTKSSNFKQRYSNKVSSDSIPTFVPHYCNEVWKKLNLERSCWEHFTIAYFFSEALNVVLYHVCINKYAIHGLTSLNTYHIWMDCVVNNNKKVPEISCQLFLKKYFQSRHHQLWDKIQDIYTMHLHDSNSIPQYSF